MFAPPIFFQKYQPTQELLIHFHSTKSYTTVDNFEIKPILHYGWQLFVNVCAQATYWGGAFVLSDWWIKTCLPYLML